jgi:hypothetical protein
MIRSLKFLLKKKNSPTFDHTIYFILKKKKKIKLFTFYITSFIIQIKKIITKQKFLFFNTAFLFSHINYLLFFFLSFSLIHK